MKTAGVGLYEISCDRSYSTGTCLRQLWSRLLGNEDAGRIIAFSDSGQLSVSLDLPDLDGHNSAYLTAEHISQIAVSALGFSLGSGYSVEIIQVFEGDGTPHACGVLHNELVYNPHLDIFNQAIRLATEAVYFRLALRDYVRAINDATDCATYCYRAIDALQSSFAFRENKKDGWTEMHAALGTTRDAINATIKTYADPVRHGNWAAAKSTTGAIRNAMLVATRDILSSYLNHVSQEAKPLVYGLPHKRKKLIDVLALREAPAVVYPASKVGP